MLQGVQRSSGGDERCRPSRALLRGWLGPASSIAAVSRLNVRAGRGAESYICKSIIGKRGVALLRLF